MQKSILYVKNGKVVANGLEIPRCTRIDLNNINPDRPMEVVLHIEVDEVDIQYPFKQTESHS